MELVRIGISGAADEIIDTLCRGFEQEDSSISITVAEKNNDAGATEILFAARNPGSLGSDAIKTLSRELTRYIINKYENRLIKKIIQDRYCHLTESEQEELAELAASRMEEMEGALYCRSPREDLIQQKIEDYLKSSENIHLEGFVKFRLQEYMKRLEEYVEMAADEYLAKREYNEFIKLLRSFVGMQKPVYRRIHIVAGKEGLYEILDDKQEDITLECAREFLAELEEGAGFDDILVSSLITMSPEKIILHGSSNFRNRELLDTIKNVFPGRLVICSKCRICDKIQ